MLLPLVLLQIWSLSHAHQLLLVATLIQTDLHQESLRNDLRLVVSFFKVQHFDQSRKDGLEFENGEFHCTHKSADTI